MDVKLFTAYLSDFFDAYDKQSEKILNNQLAFGAWFDYLSENLSEEDLKPALQNALVRYEFLPSPKQVVEAFKGSREVFALEEWQTCLEVAKRGRTENVLLTPQGEKALGAIGGFQRLGQECSNNLSSFVRKDFINYWLLYERAIRSGSVSPPPPKLTASPPDPPPKEEYKPWDKETKQKWRKAMEVLKKRQQEMRGEE